MGAANGSSIAAMEHSRMLAHTLSQSSDPKFQVCVDFFLVNQ